MKPIKKAVHLFIKNCGGISKVEEAIAATQVMKQKAEAEGNDNQYMQFALRLSKRPGGARQFVAAALLGFTLAALTYDATEEAAERN